MQVTEEQARGIGNWGDLIHYFADTARSRTVYMGFRNTDHIDIDVFKRAVDLKI